LPFFISTALIGNVAHDLKTPLQSFRMELESLKNRITKDYKILEVESDQNSFYLDDDHPLSTIISLNAAIDFMSMAINRSIDFAKVYLFIYIYIYIYICLYVHMCIISTFV
jgi:signal transduction histidine kinase